MGWDKHGYNRYEPPIKHSSPYLPQFGLYSSHDPSVIAGHMDTMDEMGVNSLVLQFYGSNQTGKQDNEISNFSKQTLELMLNESAKRKVSTTVIIQGYEERTWRTVWKDLKYLMPLIKMDGWAKIDNRPIVVIYEPHSLQGIQQALYRARKKIPNLFFVATFAERYHIAWALEDGFDAVLTYFASNGYTWGSTSSNWKSINQYCDEREIMLIPGVGPGFDEGYTPYYGNDQKRDREEGHYFKWMLDEAISANPRVIFINSFNNHRQKTGIELFVEREGKEFTETSWGLNKSPYLYLTIAKHQISIFKNTTADYKSK